MQERTIGITIMQQNKVPRQVNVPRTDLRAILNRYHEYAMADMARSDGTKSIVYGIHLYSTEDDLLTKMVVFRGCLLTESELDQMSREYPNAVIYAIHPGSYKACQQILKARESLKVRPLTIKEAQEFVSNTHRHLKASPGCRFSLGLFQMDKLVGVAMCGRPVARAFNDQNILEVNRLAVKPNIPNACSLLYSHCIQTAKAMGYSQIITYTLESESGSSVRAAGFKMDPGLYGAGDWSGTRSRGEKGERKRRWRKALEL